MLAFGPIPSRRLGQSLGVNTIPPKHCSYACVYCQVHCATRMATLRREFYPVSDVLDEVRQRVARCRETQQPLDYVSIVPDGEPTLDTHLGEVIAGVRELGVPVAVITNGTLLWRSDVRRELADAQLVSVKVDAVLEEAWRRVNRPSPQLRLDWVLAGIRDLAREFRGTLITETMLVAGANDDVENVSGVAAFLARLEPAQCYLSLPTRPPAEADVRPPAEDVVVRAFALMRDRLPSVELLGVEVPGDFGRTGSALEDLHAILRIHPMLESAVVDYLGRAGLALADLQPLVDAGIVQRVEYRGAHFFAARTRIGE